MKNKIQLSQIPNTNNCTIHENGQHVSVILCLLLVLTGLIVIVTNFFKKTKSEPVDLHSRAPKPNNKEESYKPRGNYYPASQSYQTSNPSQVPHYQFYDCNSYRTRRRIDNNQSMTNIDCTPVVIPSVCPNFAHQFVSMPQFMALDPITEEGSIPFVGLFGIPVEKRNLIRQVTINDDPVQVDEGQRTCSICLEDLEAQQNVNELSCCHRFHLQCLNPWFDRHNTCPNCRERIQIPQN